MTDYRKLRFLVVESKKLNGNFDLLLEILQTNQIESELVSDFSAGDLIKQDRFISFLYFLGFLSLKKQGIVNLIFTVPNNMCRELLWEYIRNSLSDVYSL